MPKLDREKGLGGVWALVGTAAAGLAAGAAASHLIGLRVRRARVPSETSEHPPLGPQDYEAREPGRGRAADRPHRIPRKGWTDILWRVGAAYFGDRVGFVAGGVTFFVVLSLFPTLAAFVTLYGLFADPAQAWSHLAFLYGVLPEGVAGFIGGELQRLASGPRAQLTFTLIWTLSLSLWSANGAVKTLFYGLNIAYHEVEKRNIVRYNLTCMAFTVSGLAFLLLAAGLVIGVPAALALLGLEAQWARLAPLRWPILFVAYVAAMAVIYRFGPCRAKARWRWLTPGALVAAVLSLTVSFVFSWYLSNFVRVEQSYGPLGAMMGFILWTWITVQVVLIGAELNAEIEHQTAVDTTTGQPRPLGERGAVVADTIGPKRGSPAALAFTLKHAEALSDRLMRRRVSRDAEGG